MTREQALAGLGQMIGLKQDLSWLAPQQIDICLEEADLQLRLDGNVERGQFTQLREIAEALTWERCTGCGKDYRYPHLCREHLLCGTCHPEVTP